MKPALRFFLASLLFVAGTFAFTSTVEAATITICDSGCDYISLNAAVTADVAGPDTYVLQTGYNAIEPGYIYLQDDTTLTCDPGVIFGNLGAETHLEPGENLLVQDCQFQRTRFQNVSYTPSNVTWLRNTFLTNSLSYIRLVTLDGFTISDNVGLQHIDIMGSQNGVISGNDMECRSSNRCIDLRQEPDNIDIHENTITHYDSGPYPWVDIFNATNIDFTSNTLRSVPTPDGSRMLAIQRESDNITVRGNLFIFPEDPDGEYSGALAIHVRARETDMNIAIEHNSFIGNPAPIDPVDMYTYAQCLNVDDDGTAVAPTQINITYRYNLCSFTFSDLRHEGIRVSEFPNPNYQFNLIDEYNGFFGTENPIYSDAQTYTTSTLSPTTLYSDPVLRTENGDILDDYLPAPMSRYLDVNGTIDIGALDGGARINTYTIDDDCVVDYTACHSQNIGVLDHVAMDDDNVTVAAGTYPGLSLSGPVSNLTVQGAGPTTIFDGNLNFQSALSLMDVSNSSFSGLSLVNSTETPPVLGGSMAITLPILAFGGNDYDDLGGVIFIEDILFNLTNITADGDPVNVSGVTNINGFIFDDGGSYYTILAPENVADSILEMQTLIGITPTHFIEDFFIANGDGTYTFSSTNLDNQGITLAAGMTNPPTLVGSISNVYSYNAAGLKLDNANNNTFENLFIGNNDVGVLYVNGATGNSIEDTIFDTNIMQDIVSNTASGINDLVNILFTRTMSAIDDGTVRVFYDASVRVVDPLLTPLEGVGVQFLSNNGLTNINATTNAIGLTPEVETLAYLMTPSSIALTGGDYNPFTITAFNNGIYPTTSTPATLSEISVFEVVMSQAPVTPPASSGGGGGGLPSIDPRTGTYPPIEPVEPTAPTTPVVKETRIHMLVKLEDDRNPETQEDSTVYYIGADNKRHIIPNESVFNSWYCDFRKVVITDRATLSKYPIGSNVTYRPGLNLVKFPTNPRVYVVQAGRLLRPIKDEASATAMFSAQWAKLVRDLPDTSYSDYVFGDEIPEMTDLSSLNLSPSYPSGEMSIKGYYEIVTGGQECR